MKNKLTIAIAASAIFNLEQSRRIFQEKGLKAHNEFQIAHETDVLEPGPGFNLARKFIDLNEQHKDYEVEVILLSTNPADTGLRIFNSIEHHGLKIARAAFTGGSALSQYIDTFSIHLYLSNDSQEVSEALKDGIAAAVCLPNTDKRAADKIRVAFDGDASMFSEEYENTKHPSMKSSYSLPGGVYKEFLRLFQNIQSEYPTENSPIRTAVLTSRSNPMHEQVIKTLRAWKINIDEALFVGDSPKSDFISAFAADCVFDDNFTQKGYELSGDTGYNGIVNFELKKSKSAK